MFPLKVLKDYEREELQERWRGDFNALSFI